jgi:DNA topoisomerase-3
MAKMNYERQRIEDRDARAPRKYKPIKHYKNQQQKQNAPPQPECARCKSPMVRRTSEYGPFWGCSQYPACKGTRK